MPILKPLPSSRQPLDPAAAHSSQPAVLEDGAVATATDLRAQLLQGDADARRAAAQALAADPATTALLAQCLAEDTDAGVRDALFGALAQHPGDAVVRAVLPLLRSADAALRNGVIALLQQMPDAVAPHVHRMLDDPSADVRIFTVNILESLRHPAVKDWLAGLLEAEPHVNVCAAAIDVLAEVGDATCIPVLQATKARFADDVFIGFAVDVAVGQLA